MSCYINSIYPNNLLTGQSKEISVSGGGFVSPIHIIINNMNISPSLVTPNLLKFIIPTIPKGTYSMIIKNGDNFRWLSKSILTINDGGNLNSLIGSSACPIVLPQRIIDSSPTAQQNNNIRDIIYTSPANVSVSTLTNTAVGIRKINSSFYPTESSNSKATANSENNTAIINSPWGSFTN